MEGPGQLVHRRLQGEGPLHVAGSAEGHRGTGIGVDGDLLGAHVGAAVERLVGAADVAPLAPGAVPGRLFDPGVDGGQGAVAPGAEADALTGRVAVAHGQVLRLAVEHQLHRAPAWRERRAAMTLCFQAICLLPKPPPMYCLITRTWCSGSPSFSATCWRTSKMDWVESHSVSESPSQEAVQPWGSRQLCSAVWVA